MTRYTGWLISVVALNLAVVHVGCDPKASGDDHASGGSASGAAGGARVVGSGSGGTAIVSASTTSIAGSAVEPVAGTLSAAGGVPTSTSSSTTGGASSPCNCAGSGGSVDNAGGSKAAAGGTTSNSGGSKAATGGTTSSAAGTTSESGSASTGGTVVTAGTAGNSGTVSAIAVTSAEGAYWQTASPIAVMSGTADITVNASSEAQIWEGFGGGFTELGWAYLSKLPEADRALAMQLLFGLDGARFAWGRIPIGCNDYVLSHYTLDDTGDDVVPDSTESNRPPADPTLSQFSIERDQKNLLPYIKAAQAQNPNLRFWAVPWTPPVWMKTGYQKDNGSGSAAKKPSYYDGGIIKSDDATLQAHAQYFVKFVQAFKAQGINVEMVAPQNEPSAGHTYPSCAWDKSVYTNFIGKYLGPALTDAGLSTKIMLGGSFDVTEDSVFINAVLADSTAKGYCAVAGLGYDMVDATRVAALKSAGIPVWVSEHKAGNYYWLPGYQPKAPNDMAYAIETWGLIRDAITKVGVSAYFAWHMILDSVGKNIDATTEWAQDTLLVADSGKLTAAPAYYVFRHFSRYVEPGAKVIGATGSNSVAFKNPDGSLVLVLYNSGAAKTMTVAMGGANLQLSIPSKGFATIVKQ